MTYKKVSCILVLFEDDSTEFGGVVLARALNGINAKTMQLHQLSYLNSNISGHEWQAHVCPCPSCKCAGRALPLCLNKWRAKIKLGKPEEAQRTVSVVWEMYKTWLEITTEYKSTFISTSSVKNLRDWGNFSCIYHSIYLLLGYFHTNKALLYRIKVVCWQIVSVSVGQSLRTRDKSNIWRHSSISWLNTATF